MLKKSLIALVLVALCSAPALAHVSWGYGQTTTISWSWESRPGPTICVKMEVVMWAKLYVSGCLVVHQYPDQDGYTATFGGCKEVELCVNFRGIKVDVAYVEILRVSKDTGNNGNKGKNFYRIKIESNDAVGTWVSSGWSGWSDAPSAHVEGDSLHTTTIGNKKLLICLEIRDVDPQYLEYSGGQLVKIGEITTKLTPTLMPPTVLYEERTAGYPSEIPNLP